MLQVHFRIEQVMAVLPTLCFLLHGSSAMGTSPTSDNLLKETGQGRWRVTELMCLDPCLNGTTCCRCTTG